MLMNVVGWVVVVIFCHVIENIIVLIASQWTVVNGQWLNLAKSLRALIFLRRTRETRSCCKTAIFQIFFRIGVKLIFFAQIRRGSERQSPVFCVTYTLPFLILASNCPK